jgi:hypothetical protein
MTKKAVSKKGVSKRGVARTASSKASVAEKPASKKAVSRTSAATKPVSKKAPRKPRALPEPPSWDALRERAGVNPGLSIYRSEHLAGLGPDARMVVAFDECLGHMLSDGGQFFLTNGILGDWGPSLAAGLRRLGTPSARVYAKGLARMVAIAEKACVLEDQIDTSIDEEDDPVMWELSACGDELDAILRRVYRIDDAIRRDVVERLEGKRPRKSRWPWPKVPRVSAAVRRAWG